MAHSNIIARRKAIQAILQIRNLTRKDAKQIADQFNCTTHAVQGDIIVIKHGTTSGVSPSMKKKIIKRDGNICYLCKQEIDHNQEIIIEHIIPARAGGKAKESNLAVACTSCNNKKRYTDKDLYPDEYLSA